MTEAARPWRTLDRAVELRVRVTPKASRDEVCGLEETADGPAIKTRVRALPADGAANAAIEKLIAGWLGVPKSSVTVSRGMRSRVKILVIDGNAAQLKVRLDNLWQHLAEQ